MRVVVITQDEPFYLAENFEYFLKKLPKHSKVVGCVVNDVSPFGKKESFVKKAQKTYSIFGLKFFIYYSFKFLLSKLLNRNNLLKVLGSNNIPVIKLEEKINHKHSVQKIKDFNPDLLVSILGNQIFKEPIINLAPKGCLNLHTALLPKYRGLMPTFWVLKNDEKYTGVSVFYVDKGIDSGPIIIQKKVEIGKRSQKDLIKLTKKMGMDAIAEAIDRIELDEVKLIPNLEQEKTYYTFPTRNDVVEFKRKGKKFI